VADSHLRSSRAVTAYRIAAANGRIGNIGGFLMDEEAWVIRYQAATRNWRPGKKALVSTARVMRVSWTNSKVDAGPSRKTIKSGPEFAASNHSRV
jgi:hypothetical protein